MKVIEGRGYDPDGKVTFNAFGTISFNPATKVYTLHSHAMGNVGDFVLTPSPDGYTWDIPAGPTAIRYTADIKDRAWREVGDRIVPGKDPCPLLRDEPQARGRHGLARRRCDQPQVKPAA